MRHFVNKDKILEAYITEPYANSGESWDISSSKGWEVVLTMGYLQDGYPEESICDKCTGCGTFKLNNEDAECVIDYEDGQCVTRYFDAEEFGLEVETCLDDIYELLYVDNVE